MQKLAVGFKIPERSQADKMRRLSVRGGFSLPRDFSIRNEKGELQNVEGVNHNYMS